MHGKNIKVSYNYLKYIFHSKTKNISLFQYNIFFNILLLFLKYKIYLIPKGFELQTLTYCNQMHYKSWFSAERDIKLTLCRKSSIGIKRYLLCTNFNTEILMLIRAYILE